MKKQLQNFISGQWRSALSGESLLMIDPATGQGVATVPRSAAPDVDLAVVAAQEALTRTWGCFTATERGRLLCRLGAAIMEDCERLTELEALDTGKPYWLARSDVETAARYCEFYGGAADKLMGHVIPYQNDYQAIVVREPIGVTGHILPWNYPAQMFGRSLMPALAMGNAVVLKPSEDACLSILAMCELVEKVGFPAGTINVVTGLGEEAGAALLRHPGIGMVSFTGSPEVGTLVQQECARRHVKCVLELGGKSPQIVFEDADLDRAAATICRAITQNSGQTCSAGTRVLVQATIFDALKGRLVSAISQACAGIPSDNEDCGPLINATQLERVKGFIERGRNDGVPLLAQGQVRVDNECGGYFVPPTLFGPVPENHELAKREVFGPVLSLLPFDDEADAVRLANATDYGLLAGIWTRDGSRQTRIARQMHCGQVYINCYGAGAGVELPFGGVKSSGHGREKGFLALEEFCTIKTIVQYHAE